MGLGLDQVGVDRRDVNTMTLIGILERDEDTTMHYADDEDNEKREMATEGSKSGMGSMLMKGPQKKNSNFAKGQRILKDGEGQSVLETEANQSLPDRLITVADRNKS
jgi:hypothetical protein